MSDDASGSSHKFTLTKEAIWAFAIKAGVGILLPMIAYIALQSVSRPYYTIGTKIFAGTNCFQTVFVVNPGPWKTRFPEIEFPIASDVSIVDYSPGVSVVLKENKQTASMDNGLPPGCNYFITYKFTPSPTIDSSPGVVCDGKKCKDSPTIDLDIIMYLLILVGLASAIAALLSIWECIDTKAELKKEKSSNVNKALTALIDRCEAQADVSESIHTLVAFMSGKGASVRATPLKKENGKPKKS